MIGLMWVCDVFRRRQKAGGAPHFSISFDRFHANVFGDWEGVEVSCQVGEKEMNLFNLNKWLSGIRPNLNNEHNSVGSYQLTDTHE